MASIGPRQGRPSFEDSRWPVAGVRNRRRRGAETGRFPPSLSLASRKYPPNFRALLLSVQLWLPWSSYPAAVCQSVFLFSSSFSSLSSTLPLPYPFHPYPLFLALCFDLQLVSFPTQSLLYCYTAIFTTDHCTRTKTTTSFAERN